MRPARFVPLLAALALATSGCSSSFDAIQVISPDEAAAYGRTKLAPTAILRGDARADLPQGAHVVAQTMRIPRPGVFEYQLDPGETVQTDTNGRVVAIQSGTRVTSFIPGTATRTGDVVRGELVDHEERVALQPDDRIELKGTLTVGDKLPYGGTVERTTSGGAIAMGIASVVLGYAPSAFVAATSTLSDDGWLWVPFVGPWVDLAMRPKCVPDEIIAQYSPVDPCIPETLAKVGLVASGVLQGLGALLTVVGLPSGAHAEWGDRHAATIRIEPTFGKTNGLALGGTF